MRYLVICLMIFGSCPVMSATCIGGRIVNGLNGHDYCVSLEPMNWWSAHQWCQGQARHLATPEEACNYGNKVWGGGSCPNFQNNKSAILNNGGEGWLNLTVDGGKAYTVTFYSGQIIRNVWSRNLAEFGGNTFFGVCY